MFFIYKLLNGYFYLQPWDRDSMHQSHTRIKQPVPRTQILGAHPGIDIKPPSHYDDMDNNALDFDDLIYALKSGAGYPPSDITPNVGLEPEGNITDSTNSQYEMRRINIADTHLWLF